MTWSVSDTSSNSHPVAVLSGCTNIPRAAGGAQVGETILILGFSSQPWNRFVHLDPPGADQTLGDDRIRVSALGLRLSSWPPRSRHRRSHSATAQRAAFVRARRS